MEATRRLPAETSYTTSKDATLTLTAQTAGTIPAEAGVRLLIQHGNWLSRQDLRRFIDYEADPDVTGGAPMARVRWPEVIAAIDAGRLRATGSEENVLRLAASLIAGVPVDLRAVTSGFGAVTRAQVAAALQQAVAR
jgi:hypothetical protein